MAPPFTPGADAFVLYRTGAAADNMSPAIQTRAPHFHYLHELVFAQRGTARFVVAGRPYELRPGSLLFVSNLETHFIETSGADFARYSLCISNALLSAYVKNPLLFSVFRQRPAGFTHLYDCPPPLARQTARLFAAALEESTQAAPFWDALLAARVQEILVGVYRACPAAFPATRAREGLGLVSGVQDYIAEHLAGDLSLDAVASRFYISKFYLAHIFKEVTGYSFGRYVLLERFSKAKDLLLASDAAVGEVGEMVGFHSASHFIRAFKKAEGVPPNQYRRLRGARPPLSANR